jgi:fumarylpyruvate hydrolase
MTNFIIPAAKPVAINIKDSDQQFPVRRVYCIGQNYADHVSEMGSDPSKESPIFFQKNPDNIDTSGTFPYPSETSNVHHEVEMIVALQSGGSNISEQDAYKHVYGFATALDMTRRDLQGAAKKNGKPWEIGKAFEHSAPMGIISPLSQVGTMQTGVIALSINGVEKQRGDLKMMIWSVPKIIAYLSRFNKLEAGDIIMTGTPAGVGPVQKGDKLVASITGLTTLEVVVV